MNLFGKSPVENNTSIGAAAGLMALSIVSVIALIGSLVYFAARSFGLL